MFIGFTVVTEIAPIPVGAVSQRHEKFADAGLKPTPFIAERRNTYDEPDGKIPFPAT
jgi:hypothetical protein